MYPENENKALELKESMADSFLKTVSAFANYTEGRILFGVSDDRKIKGITDAETLRLQIENKINDNIKPRPIFKLETQMHESKKIVELTIFKGNNTPYFYKNIAYKRSDTSSTPVDHEELRRLVIEGSDISYDQFPSPEKELKFTVLENALKNEIGIKHFNEDIMRTLGLFNGDSYTIAAQLLADKNDNNQSATSIIRFGKNNSVFLDRVDMTYQSLLSQYQGALDMFDKWYKPYEEVVGFSRIERIHIPREAFREAVANALIHRRFDANSAVQISMYEDHITVTSPGGLPEGITEAAYLYSQISMPRNITIAEVFHRLHIIEKFGTGIDRIQREYKPYTKKPEFKIMSHFISINLPVVEYNGQPVEDDLNQKIIHLISKNDLISRAQLEKLTGYKKTRVHEILKSLVNQGIIETVGKGNGILYRIKNSP